MGVVVHLRPLFVSLIRPFNIVSKIMFSLTTIVGPNQYALSANYFVDTWPFLTYFRQSLPLTPFKVKFETNLCPVSKSIAPLFFVCSHNLVQ